MVLLSIDCMKENIKLQKPDEIEPMQLLRIWSDEYDHECSVLGTFTSRTALGLYLVSLLEEDIHSSYSRLDNLFLRKIEINPSYEGGNP